MNDTSKDLEGRAAIADLVHRYAHNIRLGRPADCGALFTEDGVFEIRDVNPLDPQDERTRASLAGRSAIVDYVTRSATSGFRNCPLIHNLLIEVDGDTAHSVCMMESRTWPPGSEVIGEYRDSFRNDSGWRFSSRIFTIYKSAP